MKWINVITILCFFLCGIMFGFIGGRNTKPFNYGLGSELFYYGCITGVLSNSGKKFDKCIDGANIIQALDER